MAAPREPGLRQLLEAYRLAEPLGGGADGQVLRGVARRGPDQGVSHAIKKFKKEAYDPSRELEVLERIQAHPNVLRLLGVYEHGSAKAFSTPLQDEEASGPCRNAGHVILPAVAVRFAAHTRSARGAQGCEA